MLRRIPNYFYWNLHRNVWSRMIRGKVTDHAHSVVLGSTEFRVRPAGRNRVLREGKKNVHAFAVSCSPLSIWHPKAGALVAEDLDKGPGAGTWVEVNYDPLKGANFYRKDNCKAITRADRVVLTADKRVFAQGVE